MNLVEFLNARIDEQEKELQGRDFIGDSLDAAVRSSSIAIPDRLVSALLAECAVKRRILGDWETAAAADGIADPADAEGSVAIARRSMLMILAAGYKNHPDYDEAWSLGH